MCREKQCDYCLSSPHEDSRGARVWSYVRAHGMCGSLVVVVFGAVCRRAWFKQKRLIDTNTRGIPSLRVATFANGSTHALGSTPQGATQYKATLACNV